jgi:hypothetical protein
MRLTVIPAGTAFAVATAAALVTAAPASALDDFRTRAILSQCVNQSSGVVRDTDFCNCFRIGRDDLTQEWLILDGAGVIGPACPIDPTVTGSVNDGVVGPPIIRDDDDDDDVVTVLDPDWPGWGYGDENHDHAGPPNDPPGQNVPPGQRD